jgi:hypothetical protein
LFEATGGKCSKVQLMAIFDKFSIAPWAKISLTYFAIISFGLAQPLFNSIQLFRREFDFDLFHVLLIVFFFQYFLTALLVGVRYIFRRWAVAIDFVMIFGLVVSLLRQIQQNYSLILEVSTSFKFAMIAGMLILAILFALYSRRLIFIIGVPAGILSPIFGLFFLQFIFTHPLPLTSSSPAVVQKFSALPPVFLFALDELSLKILLDKENKIDEKKFPNLSAFSKDSVWYRQAITHHPYSQFAFLSMFTGKYVTPKLKSDFGNDIEIVPERSLLKNLRTSGYLVNVYSNHFGCSNRLFNCRKYVTQDNPLFLWRVFSTFLETFGPEVLLFRYLPFLHSYQLMDEYATTLEFAKHAQPGNFYFAHMLISHAPYLFDRNGGFRHTKHYSLVPGADNSQALISYREQVRFVDTNFGNLISVMKKSGAYDKSIILLIADHGNCWTDDCPGRIYPSRINVIETSLSRIPIMIKAPKLAPRIDDGDFQLVDVFPTVMDILGLPIKESENLDGRSGMRSTEPTRKRLFFINPTATPVDVGLPVKAVKVEKN